MVLFEIYQIKVFAKIHSPEISILRPNGDFEILKFTENVNSMVLGQARNEKVFPQTNSQNSVKKGF